MSATSPLLRLRRWYTYRLARVSIPALLAGSDERRITALVTAINGGLAILTLTALAWLVDVPLLFPALGPSAFLLFSSPFSKAAAPRSVILGHFTCITAGYVTWRLVGIVAGEPVLMTTGGWPVLASASIAMIASAILLIWLACPHAPSCASALIVALGAATDAMALLGMLAGVILITGQAVLFSRLAGVGAPLWFPRPRDDHAMNREDSGSTNLEWRS